MTEHERTLAIEAVLEAVRVQLAGRGYTVAPGLTVRQTADGAEHFILEVSRAGASREVHVTVAVGGDIASSVVQTRRVAGRRQRAVNRETAVPDPRTCDPAALADDLAAELP